MQTREFLMRADVSPEALEWMIDAGWLRPHRAGGGWQFEDIDLSRAQLIGDLRHDLGVNDDGIPIILDLVDQVCGLRRMLRQMEAAIRAEGASAFSGEVGPVRRRKCVLGKPRADST
jgi:chaperone modulatory protein CbpM